MNSEDLVNLLRQLWSKFTRDQGKVSTLQLGRKSWRYVESLALSSSRLRNCTKVGARARVHDRPHIDNLGTIIIGNDLNLNSRYVPTHLVTGPTGRIEIGDSVNINYGVGISAQEVVHIGSNVRIGPYTLIMDSDYHGVQNRNQGMNASVLVSDNVWLAARVTILKGSRIGLNSVITAGSVVSGNIPPNVVAGGVPARVLRRIEPSDDRTFLNFGSDASSIPPSVPPASTAPRRTLDGDSSQRLGKNSEDLILLVNRVIADTFDIDGPIETHWGPDQIPKWNSLGHIQLVLALQDRFCIRVTEEQLLSMTSISRIYDIVLNEHA